MSAIHDKQVSQEKKDIVAALKEEMQSAKGAAGLIPCGLKTATGRIFTPTVTAGLGVCTPT